MRALIVALALGLSTPVFAQTATVNFAQTKQRIDGFGGAQPQAGLTVALADQFFTTTKGIGLSLFRLSFATNSSGPTPYYPEQPTIAGFYSDAALAADRGAKVWSAPWSAMNTTWKDNGSFIEGNLLSGHYSDFSTFVSGLQADLVSHAAPNLYAMSVLNEPDLSTATYTSMQMTAAAMVTYLKTFGPAVKALSPAPLIIGPENFNWDNAGTYLSTLQGDNTAYGYLDIIATHQYAGTVATLSTSGKRVWETEMSGLNDTFDATMTHGMTVASWIHSALTTGNVNAWHYWWLVNTNNSDNEGLIGNAGDSINAPTMTKRFSVLGQWSKWVRPGWWRVSVSGGISGVSISAFRDPGNKSIAIVAVNASGSTQSQTFTLNDLTLSSVTPYVTSSTQDLAQQSALTVTAGSFTASIANNTVTTFVGTPTSGVTRIRRIH